MVDQILRQNHLLPFYGTIISPRTNMHRDKSVEFDKVYQMKHNLSNIYNRLGDNDEESNVFKKRINYIFSVFNIPLSLYYSAKERVFFFSLYYSIHILRKLRHCYLFHVLLLIVSLPHRHSCIY